MSGLPALGTLMAIGVEPARVRLCLLEPVQGSYRLVGWLGAARQESLSMAGQAATLCRELGRRLRRRLWHERTRTPFLTSDQSLHYPPIEHLAVTLSPVPRVRVAILGVSASQSLAHAVEAVAGGPAQVVAIHDFAPALTAQGLADDWQASRVEALILVGGYDAMPQATPARPSATPVHAMLGCAAQALALLAPTSRPTVFFAGGKWAVPHLERTFLACGIAAPVRLPNLLPTPTHVRQNTLAQALHTLYASHSQQTPGYAELAAWSNSGLAPTTLESNFARLVRAWREHQGIDQLHGLYALGDVHLHVWAGAQDASVRLCYTAGQREANEETDEAESPETGGALYPPPNLSAWPPVQLLSGTLSPQAAQQRELRLDLRWWDRAGLAPMVAAIGPVAPLAVQQVLENDLFKPAAAEPPVALGRKRIA